MVKTVDNVETSSFAQITGDPSDNTALAEALNTLPLDSEIGNSLLKSSITSYTGFVSDPDKWTGDDGTRIYIMPRSAISTGTGGALKIFADAYHMGTTDYRDLGIYFSGNQSGETGNYSNGVWYLNSKVNGTYAGENPPICVSFQDGNYQAAWFMLNDVGGLKDTKLIAGFDIDGATSTGRRTRLYVTGDMTFGFSNSSNGIRWRNSVSAWSNKLAFDSANNAIVFQTSDKDDLTGASDDSGFRLRKYNIDFGSDFTHGFSYSPSDDVVRVKGSTGLTFSDVSSGTSPSVSGENALRFTHSSPTSISGFSDGVEGQTLMVVINTSSAITFTHSSSFVMQDNSNLVCGINDVIQFVCVTTSSLQRWIQISSKA